MANFIVKHNHPQDGFSTPSFSRSPFALSNFLEPWREILAPAESTFPVRIVDSEQELILRAELPGVGKDNIQVNFAEQTLHITAEKKRAEQADQRVLRDEQSEGRLERRFRLPYPVDFDAAAAHYVDGVLELRLPKAANKSQRSITIN